MSNLSSNPIGSKNDLNGPGIEWVALCFHALARVSLGNEWVIQSEFAHTYNTPAATGTKMIPIIIQPIKSPILIDFCVLVVTVWFPYLSITIVFVVLLCPPPAPNSSNKIRQQQQQVIGSTWLTREIITWILPIFRHVKILTKTYYSVPIASETKKRRATRGRSPRCSAVVCLLTNQRRSRSMRMGPSPSHSG